MHVHMCKCVATYKQKLLGYKKDRRLIRESIYLTTFVTKKIDIWLRPRVMYGAILSNISVALMF